MISSSVKSLIEELKETNLSLEDKNALLNVLMEKIGVLPTEDIIKIEHNKVLIKGKELDIEQTIKFKEDCIVFKDSVIRKVLNEQLKYLAVNFGVRKAVNNDMLLFAKAALWLIDEEDKILEKVLI